MPLKNISRLMEANCRLQCQIVRLIERKHYKLLKEDIR